jgi:hypothetical protein
MGPMIRAPLALVRALLVGAVQSHGKPAEINAHVAMKWME